MHRATTAPAERRRLPDRRGRPTTLLSALKPGGRRSGFRRRGESLRAYVDRLDPRTCLLALSLLVASAADAYFTALHLASGAGEANPLMALALEYGPEFFVGTKIALTAGGAWFLAVHRFFPPAPAALRILNVVYAVLLLYHALLFAAR